MDDDLTPAEKLEISNRRTAYVNELLDILPPQKLEYLLDDFLPERNLAVRDEQAHRNKLSLDFAYLTPRQKELLQQVVINGYNSLTKTQSLTRYLPFPTPPKLERLFLRKSPCFSYLAVVEI